MGLIATMAALVLSLLIASAKSSYDTQNGDLTLLYANIVQLDRLLALYGPEAKPAREILRQTASATYEATWTREGVRTANPIHQGCKHRPARSMPNSRIYRHVPRRNALS